MFKNSRSICDHVSAIQHFYIEHTTDGKYEEAMLLLELLFNIRVTNNQEELDKRKIKKMLV